MGDDMKYYIRLDDASERRDVEKWDRIEQILDIYSIKPLVGVIPFCEDNDMRDYTVDEMFWDKVKDWKSKSWAIALHGYNHVCTTKCGGINPVNNRSEFAGLPLDIQKKKIEKGVEIFRKNGINPEIFFAPSHTFDDNTLKALLEFSDIRVISDTIANKPYRYMGFTFVPQQSGRVRKLPFSTTTFCYHPNTMQEKDFIELEHFLKKNKNRFAPFEVFSVDRKIGLYDLLLRKLYFARR